MRLIFWLALLIISLGPFCAFGHGDLHGQIMALTGKIRQQPANAELYLKRAELRRLHGEHDFALVDCDLVEKLNPHLSFANLVRGKILFDAGKWNSAKKALDTFLLSQSNHVEALIIRARVLEKLGQRSSAARDYTKAIEYSPSPDPDCFLERAQALTAEGKIRDAVMGIDEGVQKLGPLASLQLLAIDLELREKKFEAALYRVGQMSLQSDRKESWLALRGEILELAGRQKEAREAFVQSLGAMESLSPSRRQTPFVKDLESKVKAALGRLPEKSTDTQ